jgi:short-subunit dehydrogenase
MTLAPARYEHCLVTGASAGIGRVFAEQLAARGAKVLTLVARREERLADLAARCSAARSGVAVDVRPVVADLAEPDGPSRLLDALRRTEGPPVDLLVNNAGFGRYGAFMERGWDDHLRMYQLNMLTPAALVHALWEELAAVPGRGVIQVASTAAFQPIPYFTSYAATKAFLRSFSEGLWGEARPAGMRVLTLCPGPVPTEFGQVAGTSFRVRKVSTGAERVVREALDAYERGRAELIPGFVNRAMRCAVRFAPLRLVLWGAARVAGTSRPR